MSDQPQFMTYSVGQDLYAASVSLLKAIDDGKIMVPDDEVTRLREAVNQCNQAIEERSTYAAQIERAVDDYAMSSSNDIEIDDDPVLSISDEGVWVSAWVWVPLDGEESDAEED